MKKLTCTVALTGVALTTILGASPAFAASTPAPTTSPSASTPAASHVQIKEAYRSFEHWVSVSYVLEGGTPGAQVYGYNKTNKENTPWGVFNDKGEAVVRDLPMKAGVVNDVSFHVLNPGSAWNDEEVVSAPFDDTRRGFMAPTAVVTQKPGAKVATVELTGQPNAGVKITEAGSFEPGGYVWLDARGHATVDYPLPDHEVQYDLYHFFEGAYSAPGQMTLGEGKGTPSPEAPKADVTGTTTKGDAVVTVEGAAGNSTTVRNKEGKVVAIKMIGKSGKAQLTVPKDDTYVVRQAHGTESISKADSIVID